MLKLQPSIMIDQFHKHLISISAKTKSICRALLLQNLEIRIAISKWKRSAQKKISLITVK